MQIQQKNVTTVNLRLGNASSFVLRRSGQDFQLTISSGDDVVHVLLGSHDLQRLRRELAGIETADVQSYTVPGLTPVPMPVEIHPFQWNALDWLSYN